MHQCSQCHTGIGYCRRLVRQQQLRLPGRPSGYAVQAAHYQDTDWPQIAALYALLMRIQPSPVIELNHAAAIAMVDGPARALQLVEALLARGELEGYHLLSAVHAELLLRRLEQLALSEVR